MYHRLISLTTAVIAVLLLNSSAAAYTINKNGVEMPPVEYDHVPTRPFLQFVMPQDTVSRICNPPLPMQQIACTRVKDGEVAELAHNHFLPNMIKDIIAQDFGFYPNLCVIFIPAVGSGVSPAKQQELARHEQAHCNGIFHDPITGRRWYLPDGTLVQR